MSRSDAQRPADILDAADELAAVVARGRDCVRRRCDPVTSGRTSPGDHWRSRERAFDETTGRFPEIGWRDLARLRIVLAHHYQGVDSEQVWTIAVGDVPMLVAHLSMIRRRTERIERLRRQAMPRWVPGHRGLIARKPGTRPTRSERMGRLSNPPETFRMLDAVDLRQERSPGAGRLLRRRR